jgi:hypothetical protein
MVLLSAIALNRIGLDWHWYLPLAGFSGGTNWDWLMLVYAKEQFERLPIQSQR